MLVFSQRRANVNNRLGLHLRPASLLVRLAQQFQSDVRIHCDDREANGKSILGLVALAAACGSRLVIETRGPDAEEAAAKLCTLIERGFHEE